MNISALDLFLAGLFRPDEPFKLGKLSLYNGKKRLFPILIHGAPYLPRLHDWDDPVLNSQAGYAVELAAVIG
ncbi:TPA: hypothetical protein ACGW8Z_006595, partial [Pseudomonas aeruginosa]